MSLTKIALKAELASFKEALQRSKGNAERLAREVDRLQGMVDEVQNEASACRSEAVDNKLKLLELQAIVDKLPKTADGVPVVPGMSLYVDGPWEVQTALMLKGGSQPSRGDTWLRLSTGNYYSTREAAEAAAKEREGNALQS
jgi:predicted nuclease with TOPRIM domain